MVAYSVLQHQLLDIQIGLEPDDGARRSRIAFLMFSTD